MTQLQGRYRRYTPAIDTRKLLPEVDGRSVWARKLRDQITAFTDDLGGAENITHAEGAILRRASVLIVELERLEQKFAIDGAATPTDLDLYSRTAGNLRRLLESIGIQRRPRNVTPELHDYIEGRG